MSRAEERANQNFPEEKGLIHGISGMRYAYIRGYHQAEKDIIDKACDWLKEKANHYVDIKECAMVVKNTIIRDFCKALNKE